MNDVVRYELRDGVAVISVFNPPVNALTQPVRHELMRAVEKAGADPHVGAMVIRAEGATFPAGDDLRSTGAAAEAAEGSPSLAELTLAVEAAEKPVIAAIHGTAQGGGLELALACHVRLASAKALLGLPDVALGMMPGAGGTQRLARLVGAKPALHLLISGRPLPADAAAKTGLVDRVIGEDLAGAALDLARSMAGAGTRPRRSRDRIEGFRDPKAYLDIVKRRRAALARDPRLAVHKAVDLVEAALLVPFEVGLEMERAAHEDLASSDQARGLRHAYLAERHAVRLPGLIRAAAREVRTVGILGGGEIGAGLALACLGIGLPVVLVEAGEAEAQAARGRIEAALARGRLSAEESRARLARLSVGAAPEALAGADLVIEALPEEIEAKRAAFARLGDVTAAGTVLASTTDTLSLEALAEASGRPADVLGLRFFVPSVRAKLVELVPQAEGDGNLVPIAVSFLRRLSRVPVMPGAGASGIALPVFAAMVRAAEAMVVAGASPAMIDAAMRDYGFSQGPFQQLDAVGLELAVTWLDAAQGSGNGAGGIVGRMAEEGWRGRKGGQGFYLYSDDGVPGGPAPEAETMAAQIRRDLGLRGAGLVPEDIRDHLLWAAANAGARLVESGAARKPGDIDVAMIHGLGFPRWKGGPMEAADQAGLVRVRNRLRAWAAEENTADAALWTPAAIFDELIRTGRRFDDLNG